MSNAADTMPDAGKTLRHPALREARWTSGAVALATLLTGLGCLGATLWGDKRAWWYGALVDATAVRALTFGLLAAGLLGPVAGAMVLLGRSKVRDDDGRRGNAVLEFALLFPVAMVIILVMVQSAMLMTSNLMVHYAAWCATRTAIVVIPSELDGEGRNELASADSSAKLATIRQAAAYALLPIAGTGEPDDRARPLIACVVSVLDDRQTADNVGWAILRRYGYATDAYNTIVTIDPPTWRPDDAYHDDQDGALDGIAPSGTYGPCETIALSLTHRAVLGVPYVNRIFGYEHPRRPGRYVTDITAHCAMVNRGWFDGVVQDYDSNGDLMLPH